MSSLLWRMRRTKLLYFSVRGLAPQLVPAAGLFGSTKSQKSVASQSACVLSWYQRSVDRHCWPARFCHCSQSARTSLGGICAPRRGALVAVPAVCGVVDGLAVGRIPALVVQVGARRAAAIRRAVRGPPADGGQQPVGDGKAGPGFARRQVLLEDRVSADVFDKRHAWPGVLARGVGVRVRGARAPNATGLAVVVSVRIVEIGGLCLVVLPPGLANEPPVVEAPVQRAHLLRGVGGVARKRAVVEDALVRYARVFLFDPVVGRRGSAG